MYARDHSVHYHFGSSHWLSCTFDLGAVLLTITQSASVRGSAGEPLPKVWDNLEARFLRGQLALVAAGPGCIAGDAEIIVNRAGNSKRVRLDDLVSLFNGDEVPIRRNGKPTKGKRKWDTSIDTYVQCEIDGHMRSAKLKKAWYSGEKTTYTVTTDTGRKVRATDIHPFLTTEGWKKLGELEPGDVVHVHHKDENHLNNSLENLEILSQEEHLSIHGEQYVTNVLEKVAYESVVSIEEYGQEPTYDLELDTEPHNFTANGFVVHNTGKSAFVLNYALRSGVSCLYFSADSDAYVQVSRALAILGGLDMADAGELVKSNDVEKISEITEGSPVRFSYNTSPTLTHIEYQIRAYEELYGDFPELIVVDNALDVQMDFEDDQSQSLDALMAWLHDMARTTGSCVIVLHHVTGPFNDADKPIPLSGVKGQIGRVPELILTLHKQSQGYSSDQLLCVSTVKNRGQRADPSGQTYAELSFNGQQMAIVDARDTAGEYQFSDPYEMEMYGL